ncbi:helix-turn-helix domain-containing protein [Amycolatopsis sp. ATCC 39116]|uniref:helix-turn-helix domain-containing protein n=1 Tax=Amycolatopsis sp. (strain ATCC 39116 / 75iv2) TaxID=385957 RepID=UPI0012F81A94|nr:helix-turn-helix domain-containing protein [Amycolatopsis sp. ATCC 39116]
MGTRARGTGRRRNLFELAAELDAPRSSLHGLAKGLVATGYLRDADRRRSRTRGGDQPR